MNLQVNDIFHMHRFDVVLIWIEKALAKDFNGWNKDFMFYRFRSVRPSECKMGPTRVDIWARMTFEYNMKASKKTIYSYTNYP